MREEPSFRIFFERFRASKWKLEIDDPKPPKKRKVLRHYAEGEAPVEFVSTVEEHYTRFLSQHKDYIGTLQGMEILLLKVLHEEYFGHELSQYLCFLAMS